MLVCSICATQILGRFLPSLYATSWCAAPISDSLNRPQRAAFHDGCQMNHQGKSGFIKNSLISKILNIQNKQEIRND